MGVFSGTLSYMRYFVEGASPIEKASDKEALIERLQLYATPELTPEHEEDQVHGWALVERVLDTEFTQDKIFFNDYLLLSLRIDSWKIPSALLKAHQAEAERAYMKEQNRDKLGKREKTLIRDQIKKQLKTRLLPSLAAYDACWHMESGLLRFWSLSSRANELFIELFEKTFNMQLVPQTPYTLAEQFGFDEEELVKMATLEPQAFTGEEEL